MDAYLHIPIHPACRKYLRFSLEGTVYQFCSSIGISTVPFGFYKPDGDCGRTYSIYGAQHSPIHVLRWLVYPSSVMGVPPGWPIAIMGNHYKSRSNTKSSEISSLSGLQFCRHEVSDSLWHCQGSRRVNKILLLLFRVLRVQFITTREFLSMLGSLNAAADLVHLSHLHMRPLQFHLLAVGNLTATVWTYLFQYPVRVMYQLNGGWILPFTWLGFP